MYSHALIAEDVDGSLKGRWVCFDGHPSSQGMAVFQAYRELGSIDALRAHAFKEASVDGHWATFQSPSYLTSFAYPAGKILCEFCDETRRDEGNRSATCYACQGTGSRLNNGLDGWTSSEAPLIVEGEYAWAEYHWYWTYVISDTGLSLYDEGLMYIGEWPWEREPNWNHLAWLLAAVERTAKEHGRLYGEILDQGREQLDELDLDERELALMLMEDQESSPFDAITAVRNAMRSVA